MIGIADGLLANLAEVHETRADRGLLFFPTQQCARYLEGQSPLA
jgi:hypothetical protein